MPMAVPTNVHHHTVRDRPNCPVAVRRRHGTTRVPFGRCLVTPDRVLAEQVATVLVAPFRSPAQDLAKPLAISVHGPRADGFALPFRYRRSVSSECATATRLDERLPLAEGDQVRVLLRPEHAGEHLSTATILQPVSRTLARSPVGLIQGEQPRQSHLPLSEFVLTLAQLCRLFQGVGLGPLLVAVLERQAPVPALPCCERRVERTGVQKASRLALVHRHSRTLLTLSVTPTLRFLRHATSLPSQPPFQAREPAAQVASPDYAAVQPDDAARQEMACGCR